MTVNLVQATARLGGVYVNDIKVVGEQAVLQNAVSNAANSVVIADAFNVLLAVLKTHGLVASA